MTLAARARGAVLVAAIGGALSCGTPCLAAAPDKPPPNNLAEEICFRTAQWQVYQVMTALAEGKGGNPFSPAHPLSTVKPNMEPKRLPDPDEQAERTALKIGKATLAVALPPGVETKAKGILAWCTGPEVRIIIHESATNSVSLDLPKDLRQRLRNSKYTRGQLVEKEFDRLNALPKFDLLVKILMMDVGKLAMTVPFPQRMANLHLFAQKWNSCHGVKTTLFQYYESPHLRCIVAGPFDGETSSLDDKGKVTERQEWRDFAVYFAFRKHNTVYELSYKVPKKHAEALTLDKVLRFLANCQLKLAPKPEAEPNPQEGAKGEKRH